MGKENTDSPLRAGVLALEANTVAWIWLILRLLLSKGFRRLIICRTWMNFIPPKFFLDAFMALNYITSWVVNLVNATPHWKSQDTDSAARMCRCVVNADWFMCRGGGWQRREVRGEWLWVWAYSASSLVTRAIHALCTCGNVPLISHLCKGHGISCKENKDLCVNWPMPRFTHTHTDTVGVSWHWMT